MTACQDEENVLCTEAIILKMKKNVESKVEINEEL